MHDMMEDQNPMQNKNNKHDNPATSIITSLVVLGVCVVMFIRTQAWWVFFPALFFAIFPLKNTLSRIFNNKKVRQELSQNDGVRNQKTVLRIAKENKGIVTPAMVAMNSELSIEQADELLQDITKKGFADMRVRDSGKIEYEFLEFLHESDPYAEKNLIK
jgi:hypothetical protein